MAAVAALRASRASASGISGFTAPRTRAVTSSIATSTFTS